MKLLHLNASMALIGALLLAGPVMAHAGKVPSQSGKILLDVEHKGEAWYVDPVSNERVFLANGAVAYEVLREYGLGISNADLEKIPVGYIPVMQSPTELFNQLEPMFAKCDPESRMSAIEQSLTAFKAAMDPTLTSADLESGSIADIQRPVWTGDDALCVSGTIRNLVVSKEYIPYVRAATQSIGSAFNDSDKDHIGYLDETQFGTSPWEADSDADHYQDGTEIDAGYSPLGTGKMRMDQSLVNRLKGRILLQVEGAGQAWYVHPVTGRRYYLATGADAYRLMSQLGVGAPSAMLDGIAKESESQALYAAISDNAQSCDGTLDCFEHAIEQGKTVQDLFTFKSPVQLPDGTMNEGGVQIFARYIAGPKKDYATFELTHIESGPVKGGEIIDLMAASTMLPEGMTTEQKAQLADDIEVTYAYLLVDIVKIAPRVTCVVHDRKEFLAEWVATRKAITESFKVGVSQDSLENAQSALDNTNINEFNSATCTLQGGVI